MRILITGASCAGSTTLGSTLGKQLDIPYYDTDAYFWEPTEPMFSVRRPPLQRDQMLTGDLAGKNKYIVGGSLMGWGDEWLKMFDLAVLLYIPKDIRLRRLKEREVQLYGSKLFSETERNAKFAAYLEWASGYDDNSTRGRNLAAHRSWLASMSCPVIEISGDTTVAARISVIKPLIAEFNNKLW